MAQIPVQGLSRKDGSGNIHSLSRYPNRALGRGRMILHCCIGLWGLAVDFPFYWHVLLCSPVIAGACGASLLDSWKVALVNRPPPLCNNRGACFSTWKPAPEKGMQTALGSNMIFPHCRIGRTHQTCLDWDRLPSRSFDSFVFLECLE